MEKVLKMLTEEKKDVRKGDWTNKEVRPSLFDSAPYSSISR